MSTEGLFEDPEKAIAGSHNPFFLQSQEGSDRSNIGHAAFVASQNPSGRVLGVVGMGEIGTAAAKRALGLGMSIRYHSRSRKAISLEESVGGAVHHAYLYEMLPLVDCVLVACPHSPATHHIIGAKAFKAMKRGTRLVNVGRGQCVDEAALVEAMDDEIIAGVGLDVYHNEPQVHPKLLRSWRATLLPHIGGDSQEASKVRSPSRLRAVDCLFLLC